MVSCLLWRHQWSEGRKNESFGVYEWKGMIFWRDGFWTSEREVEVLEEG
jgi:hypothetical protein